VFEKTTGVTPRPASPSKFKAAKPGRRRAVARRTTDLTFRQKRHVHSGQRLDLAVNRRARTQRLFTPPGHDHEKPHLRHRRRAVAGAGIFLQVISGRWHPT